MKSIPIFGVEDVSSERIEDSWVIRSEREAEQGYGTPLLQVQG